MKTDLAAAANHPAGRENNAGPGWSPVDTCGGRPGSPLCRRTRRVAGGEARKPLSSAPKTGELSKRELLVKMGARSGLVGNGAEYCLQHLQDQLQEAHNGSEVRRGTSGLGPIRSRALEETLQQPGADQNREPLQYTQAVELGLFLFVNDIKI